MQKELQKKEIREVDFYSVNWDKFAVDVVYYRPESTEGFEADIDFDLIHKFLKSEQPELFNRFCSKGVDDQYDGENHSIKEFRSFDIVDFIASPDFDQDFVQSVLNWLFK